MPLLSKIIIIALKTSNAIHFINSNDIIHCESAAYYTLFSSVYNLFIEVGWNSHARTYTCSCCGKQRCHARFVRERKPLMIS